MYDGRTYGLYKTINVKFNYLNSADFPDHTGYMRHDAYIDGRSRGVNFGEYTTSNGTTGDFYYNAASYSLDLYGYEGVKLSTNSVKLGADITSYLTERRPGRRRDVRRLVHRSRAHDAIHWHCDAHGSGAVRGLEHADV